MASRAHIRAGRSVWAQSTAPSLLTSPDWIPLTTVGPAALRSVGAANAFVVEASAAAPTRAAPPPSSDRRLMVDRVKSAASDMCASVVSSPLDDRRSSTLPEGCHPTSAERTPRLSRWSRSLAGHWRALEPRLQQLDDHRRADLELAVVPEPLVVGERQ